MSTFPCTCGNAIAIDPPTANAGYVVWDSEIDRSIDRRRDELKGFLSALTSGQREMWLRYFYGTTNLGRLQQKSDVDVVEDILSQFDRYTHIVYRCDACGKILVQEESGGRHFNVYSPET